jgi:hypothetical protein
MANLYLMFVSVVINIYNFKKLIIVWPITFSDVSTGHK